jgi:phosphotriesterase-related protein
VVNTVTGEIGSADLGWTLPHEHIVVAWDGTFLDSTLDIDWPAIEAKAVRYCRQALDSGVKTIVDMTTIEMGRDANLLRRVSEASGLQIVCATGLFADAWGVPHYFRELAESDLTKIFVAELTSGIGRSGVRAGVIKLATGGRDLTPLEGKLLGAVAVAARETGAPVLTHTGYGALGDLQASRLIDMGVDPRRIVIGHSDVSANLRYHLRILRTGVSVGFDRIGLLRFMPDEIRAQCIASLIRMGHAGRLTMSLDCHVQWCGRGLPEGDSEAERDYTYLAESFFPLLRAAGVDDQVVGQIMVDNVRHIFE